jgi:hypothetical protein
MAFQWNYGWYRDTPLVLQTLDFPTLVGQWGYQDYR